MAKTQEEILQLTGKNYQAVQTQELKVEETRDKLFKAYSKKVKDFGKMHTENLKVIKSEEASVKKKFKTKETDRLGKHKAALDDLDNQVVVAEAQKDQELAANITELEESIAAIEKNIAAIKKNYKKEHADLKKQLKSDHDAADKNILTINEKGAKDQASFEQKLTDLKAKYEETLASLKEKEVTKAQQQKEAHEKLVADQKEELRLQEESHTDKRRIRELAYEEELEEIDENFQTAKSEYETKYENIKSSSEKRIAVREKHLQRAINDNDQRSAKQHKKDIAKFKKEAEKDLATLEKSYRNESKQKVDYRLDFQKDHVHEMAEFDKKFAKYKEDKAFELDQLVIQYAQDQENTICEFEKYRAEELHTYNSNYKDIRHKQETVKHQELIDVEKVKEQKELFDIEFERATNVLLENEKADLEAQAKDRRLAQLRKDHNDYLSEQKLTETKSNIQYDKKLVDRDLDKDLNVLAFAKNIEDAKLQDQKHQSQKNDILEYLTAYEPSHLERAKELFQYEEQEITNRSTLKVAFLQKEIVQLQKEHEMQKGKVESAYEEEVFFHNQQIEEIAGPQKEEIERFIEEQEDALTNLKSKVDATEERKEKRRLSAEYENKKQEFDTIKAQKLQAFNQKTGVFQQAVDAAEKRKNDSLSDLETFYNDAIGRVNQSIDLVNETKDKELTNAKNRLDQTQTSLSQYDNQVVSRNQHQTDSDTTFLDTRIKQEEKAIEQQSQLFETYREANSNEKQQEANAIQQEVNEATGTYNNNVLKEEKNLEEYKSTIQAQIEQVQSAATQKVSQANNKFQSVKSEIEGNLNEELSNLSNLLNTQKGAFDNTMDDIKERVSEAKSKLDSENKRIKKELQERVKTVHQKIDADASVKIQELH